MAAGKNKKKNSLFTLFDPELEEEEEGIVYDTSEEEDRAAREEAEAEAASEQEILAAEMWRAAKLRHYRRIALIAVAVLLCLLIAFSALGAVFFKVSEVTASGCTMYEDWRVSEAARIEPGINLYAVDKKAAERAVLDEFPYISSVSVRRRLPSTIELLVTEDKPAYYCEISGEFFVLSDSLRVLEHGPDEDSFVRRFPGIVKLVTLRVNRAMVGEKIVFADTSFYDYACEMLRVFENCAIADGMTLIDFSDKYDIYLVYDDRFKVEIGDIGNLEFKMRMASEILASEDLSFAGLLNVENDPAYVRMGTLSMFLEQ